MGQITPAIPDTATVFTVTYKDVRTEVVVNAFIKADDRYIDAFDRTNLPARLELVLDEPWNGYPSSMVLIQNIVEAEPEPSAKRNLRYDNSGYERVEVDGASMWLPAETTNRYERMLALQEEKRLEREALYATATSDSAGHSNGDAGTGFVSMWGRHIVVLVLGVAALVVSVKMIL